MNLFLRNICIAAAWTLLPPGLAFAECNGASWTPDSRYKVHGDEVLDTTTRLTWKRCAQGMTWTGKTCKGTLKEMPWTDVVRTLPLKGKGWRVPSKDELATLLSGEKKKRSGCWSPALNTNVFPGRQDNYFWSSSAYDGDDTIAWLVIFDDGYVDARFRTFDNPVRLVRESR